MTKILFAFLFFASAQGYGQQNEEAEKKDILEKVNLFFKVLETKDTVLYNTIVYPNAQIWAIRPQQDTLKVAMRSFSDDMIRLVAMKTVIEEKPTSYEIKIHNNIAVVWMPYTLSLSGKFSHCGVDVFTLLKAAGGWKIVSTVYSVEPDGCPSLKRN
jgi:Putative lumazine-binding